MESGRLALSDNDLRPDQHALHLNLATNSARWVNDYIERVQRDERRHIRDAYNAAAVDAFRNDNAPAELNMPEPQDFTLTHHVARTVLDDSLDPESVMHTIRRSLRVRAERYIERQGSVPAEWTVHISIRHDIDRETMVLRARRNH